MQIHYRVSIGERFQVIFWKDPAMLTIERLEAYQKARRLGLAV